MSGTVAIAALFGLAAVAAHAAPVMIHDAGNTRALGPYTAVLGSQGLRRAVATLPSPDSVLPLRTPELTPGTARRRALAHAPLTPIFVIGSDRRSRQWLATYREQLAALGAVGLLVQAETARDLRAIARLGAGLPITPVSGAELARTLGLAHYPALLSREGIEP